MKKRVLKILFVLETLVIVLELLCLYIGVLINKNTELFREYSPDGKYILYITEIGTPDWPFGPDHLKINLYEAALPANRVSFMADVRNDGARAGYKVTWLEDGVQIALIGSEQPTAYYILPFMTMEETKEDTASEDALLTEEETMQEHDPYIPSREEVLSVREAALEGMTQEQIDRLTENIKVANSAMERAYFYDDIFGKLADKDNFYWNYFDEKGEIQIGWEYHGEYKEINIIMETENLTREEFNERYCEPVMTYNRFDADNFIELIEDMKEDVVNEELQSNLQSIIDETRLAAESHEMEHANNIFKILHDMDYFLLRYGFDDVGKYSRDDSFLGIYYGTLSFYK